MTQLNIINDFLNRMSESQNIETPYFALKHHNLYFHNEFSLPNNYDKLFYKLLKDHEPHFEDTLLVVMSDHGHRLSSYAQTREGQKEQSNPFLSIKLPSKL